MKRSGKGEKAIRALEKATRYSNRTAIDFGDDVLNRMCAEEALAEASEAMEPTGKLTERVRVRWSVKALATRLTTYRAPFS